jgi:hypothetical protein
LSFIEDNDLHEKALQALKEKHPDFDWRDGVGLVRQTELPRMGKVNLAVATGKVWLDPATTPGLKAQGWYDPENIGAGPQDKDAVVRGGVQMAFDGAGSPTMWRPHDGAWWKSQTLTGHGDGFGFYRGNEKVGLIDPGFGARAVKTAAKEVKKFAVNTFKGMATKEGHTAVALAAEEKVRSRVVGGDSDDIVAGMSTMFRKIDDPASKVQSVSLQEVERAEVDMLNQIETAQLGAMSDGFAASSAPNSHRTSDGKTGFATAIAPFAGPDGQISASNLRLAKRAFMEAHRKRASGQDVDIHREVRRAMAPVILEQSAAHLDSALFDVVRSELGDGHESLSSMWNDDNGTMRLDHRMAANAIFKHRLGLDPAKLEKMNEAQLAEVASKVSSDLMQNPGVRNALASIRSMSKISVLNEETDMEKQDEEIRKGGLYKTAQGNVGLAEFVLTSRLLGSAVRSGASKDLLEKLSSKGLKNFGTKFAVEYGQNAAASIGLNTSENARNSSTVGEFVGNMARQTVTDAAMSIPGLHFTGPKKMGAIGARLVGDTSSAVVRGVAFGGVDATAGHAVNKALGRESNYGEELGRSIGHMFSVELGFRGYGLAKDVVPHAGTMNSPSKGISSNLGLESQVTEFVRGMKSAPTKAELLDIVHSQAMKAVNELVEPEMGATETAAAMAKARSTVDRMEGRLVEVVNKLDARGLLASESKPAAKRTAKRVTKTVTPIVPVATESKASVDAAEAAAPGIVEDATRIEPVEPVEPVEPAKSKPPVIEPKSEALKIGGLKLEVERPGDAATRKAKAAEQETINDQVKIVMDRIADSSPLAVRHVDSTIDDLRKSGHAEIADALAEQVAEVRKSFAKPAEPGVDPAPAPKPEPAAAAPTNAGSESPSTSNVVPRKSRAPRASSPLITSPTL